MECRKKMVGSCGTCWSKMFGNIQEGIGHLLSKAVWIGDPSRIMSFYWWMLKPWRWMTFTLRSRVKQKPGDHQFKEYSRGVRKELKSLSEKKREE